MQDPDTAHLRTAARPPIPVDDAAVERAKDIRWMGYFVRDMDRRELLGFIAQLDMHVGRLSAKGSQLEAAPRHSLNFGQAIEALKEGRRVRLPGWETKGCYLQLQAPDDNSNMTAPYIFQHTSVGHLVPWTPGHTAMLVDHWQIVPRRPYTPPSQPRKD